MKLLTLVCGVGLVAMALCHICAIEPRQRGDMSVDTPGSSPCYRRVPQCGGMPPETPKVSYAAGSTVQLLFQQNLNHWNGGHLDIAISYDPNSENDADFSVLWTAQDYPAHDQVTQTNFTAAVVLPARSSDHAVLRYRYVSLNKGEIDPKNNTDAIFWNCVDIRITSATETPVVHPPKAPQTKSGDSCCAPNQFQMQAREFGANGEVHHQIWWDALANLTRWDRIGSLEPTKPNGRLQLFNNYTSMDEWVYDPDSDKCELYGSDPFYPWCFGASFGMNFAGNGTRNSQPVSLWNNPTNGFTWESSQDSCYPIRRARRGTRHDDSVEIEFFNQGPIRGDNFFHLPVACHKALKRVGCRR
eukprot:TRINITY_DN1207_c0_g1_i1.p1 TRINITY_DN1207_c0_g1~~TRINITY_DN1207_c0_g1_i1.p1  ORF type:complete len:358 (-),score=29.90 TRINITY_DN1207_c0_g1_i1:18-1091(-)